MLKLVSGGSGQDWACSVAEAGLGSEGAAFEVARPGDLGEASCGGPGWGCAGIPDSAPAVGMLQAGAAGSACGGQDAEELGEPGGGAEERPARLPPPPALRVLNRKPQGGSEEIKTSENDSQRGRLRRGPRAGPPASGMGDYGGQPERSAPHTPGDPAGARAAAVNGLLHNGFHQLPVQQPRFFNRGSVGGGDPAPPRLLLQPELQPQPQPPPAQHDSPAKKCRLRRRMDSGKKNRPRKSHWEGSADARQAQHAGPAPRTAGCEGSAPEPAVGGALETFPPGALSTKDSYLSLSLACHHL